MSFLNLIVNIVAFDDPTTHNNPQLLRPGWRRQWQGVPCESPGSVELNIDPLQEVVAFNGARSLTVNGLTNFEISNVPALDVSRYRLEWAGAGAAPGFRTARTVAVETGNLVLTMNANQTLSCTSTLGAVFGDVSVGDQVFIPGASTGDSGPFDTLNEGLWSVLTAAAGGLTLARLGSGVISGATETVAIADDSEFQVFSSTGVQIGDTLDIVAGFSSSTWRAYEITSVTASRVEFVSTAPVGSETAVPGASGIAIYSAAKQFVYLESDQEVALKFNGATDETNRVTPFIPGDSTQKGFAQKVGTVYSLSIKNRSTTRAKVILISAE
jgi:hypothetical protein